VERTQDIERDVKQGLGGAGRLKILHLFLWYPDHVFTRARYEIGRTVPNAAISIRNDLQPLVQTPLGDYLPTPPPQRTRRALPIGPPPRAACVNLNVVALVGVVRWG
jgi:hypothetical protein